MRTILASPLAVARCRPAAMTGSSEVEPTSTNWPSTKSWNRAPGISEMGMGYLCVVDPHGLARHGTTGGDAKSCRGLVRPRVAPRSLGELRLGQEPLDRCALR